jgi:GWxTD domain-containing protein
MQRAVVAGFTMTLLAFAVAAELSEPHRSFMSGPAGYIATKAERKSFAKVASDVEAERFVALFWAKRDPDLSTAVNEFKTDFDARVASAEAQFGGGERGRGSMSDRGRVLIVMGRPFSVTHQLPESVVERIGAPEAEKRGGIEVWTYHGEQVPAAVRANEVYFLFAETRMGSNDYPLDRGNRVNARAMKLLAAAPELLLRHPELKDVPRVGLVAGSQTATLAELSVLNAEPRPWPQGASARAVQGVRSGALFPLWVHVRLPDEVPPATQVIGRAVSAAGEDGGTFAAATTAITVPGGRAYELALPLAPGSWNVDVALVGAGGPIAVTTVTANLETVPPDGAWISPLIWGAEVQQEGLASPGDPFNVGGWHVIPQPGDRYRRADTVSYFCTMVRPGAGAAGRPSAETGIAVNVGGRTLTATPPEPAELSQLAPDLWMLGSSLPLSGFPGPGEYAVEITLRDTVSGASRTAHIPVTIVAP